MNQKIILFPYSDRLYGMMCYLLDQNIEIIPTASLGSSYIGRIIGYAVNRQDDRTLVYDIAIINELSVDYVFLSAQTEYDVHHKNIKLICKTCGAKGISLIYQGADKNILKLIELYCKPNHNLTLFNNDIALHLEKENEVSSFVDVDIPVIYLGGLVESGDSLEIALKLKSAFEELGYCALAVSNNRDIEVSEGFAIPEFFMTTQYLPEEQMSKMVKWFSAVIKMRRPDVIIVDLPKGLLTYNKRIHNSFGIYSIMLSLILNPDFFIVSLNNFELSEIDLNKYNNFLMKKLGIRVDVFNLSNRYYKVFDADYSIPKMPLYIKEDMLIDFIESFNQSSNIKLMNLASSEDIKGVMDKIIEKFSKDGE